MSATEVSAAPATCLPRGVDATGVAFERVRCVRCGYSDNWSGLKQHALERHADCSLLEDSEFRVGGSTDTHDMAAIILPSTPNPSSPTTDGVQMFGCYVNSITVGGRHVCIAADMSAGNLQRHPRALLRHISEPDDQANRTYDLEWNRWLTVPMADLERFGDKRNYEICLSVE